MDPILKFADFCLKVFKDLLKFINFLDNKFRIIIIYYFLDFYKVLIFFYDYFLKLY